MLVIVALAFAALLALTGLAVDSGRLFVNKSELQTAADACALAAAAELTCSPAGLPGGSCPASYQLNAQSAGLMVGARNRSDLQHRAVSIAPGDVRFSTTLAPNSAYAAAGAASPNATFAMCIARASRTGRIAPWFMGMVGMGTNEVTAQAVATLAPAQTVCPGAPIGICSKGAAPSFGYTLGEWINGSFTSNGNNDALSGGFKWVDYTPNGGGNSEIRDLLSGTGGTACGVSIGSNVAQPGQQQGAKSAYNTRFGLYPNGANAYTPQQAPPDRTGYAYPNKAPGSPVIGIGTSAYADYLARQNGNAVFTSNQYGVNGPGGNIPGNGITSAQHLQYGAPQRRLIAVPVIACGSGNTPILGMACVLMLNPMSNGANGTVYLEYRGNASTAGAACAVAGAPGGAGGTGARVPTLVQ